MSETYCGKSCSACDWKEELNCPGCKDGPGRQFGTDCELAKCCRDKGHEACDTCGFKENCQTLRSRERQPEDRKKALEAERRQKAEIAKRVPILGKWLWILFWLIVPATIAGIMGNEAVMNAAPGVYLIGRILGAVCSMAYGAILLKLPSEGGRYRTAGICALVCATVNILVALMFDASDVPTWSLLITLPTAIVALGGEYNEYYAHSAVLTGVDDDLSRKWITLWKCYIGCFLGLLGSILLTLIVPILGLFVLIGTSIGTIIASIMKLVYLYKTAKVFREYQIDNFAEV